MVAAAIAVVRAAVVTAAIAVLLAGAPARGQQPMPKGYTIPTVDLSQETFRHVIVDRPTLKGRLAIFDVHSKNVPLDADVDLERLASGTVGMTGADIRNLVNEAALWASRHDKNTVDMADFEYARDKFEALTVLRRPERSVDRVIRSFD